MVSNQALLGKAAIVQEWAYTVQNGPRPQLRENAASGEYFAENDRPPAGAQPVCEKAIQTGSRVAQRICQRRSQIEANQRDAQEMLGEVQKRGVLVNDSKQ